MRSNNKGDRLGFGNTGHPPINLKIMEERPVVLFARYKVKDGHLIGLLDLLKEVTARSTEEQGNLFYYIHQSHADSNTLMLYEAYENKAAVEYHFNSQHFRDIVIGKIMPLLEDRDVILSSPLQLE